MIVAAIALLSMAQAPNLNLPVTFGEIKDVFHRVQAAMAETVNAPVGSFAGFADSSKPATREAIIDEMNRLSHLYENAYVLKPRTQYCRPSVVKLAPAEKDRAIKLIKLGFVAPVSQLVVGPQDTLSPLQFGIAVAYFIERFADMTHTPSIKWSPYLENDGVPPPPTAKPKHGK